MRGGPTPAQTRKVIQDLIDALAKISAGPRRGGPASIGPAREIAGEALRVMPMRYMPRDEEWVAVPGPGTVLVPVAAEILPKAVGEWVECARFKLVRRADGLHDLIVES